MEGVIANDYKLGDKVDTKMTYATDTKIDWTLEGSLIEICGDYKTLLGSNVKDILWNSPPATANDKCLKYDFIVDKSLPVAN